MAKRLVALLGMVALLLTTAVPVAFAQVEEEEEEEEEQYVGGEEVPATGVLVAELPADVATNGTHSIFDGATGTLYALRGAGADLGPHAGERVTARRGVRGLPAAHGRRPDRAGGGLRGGLPALREPG